jgi:hypothetical protein
MTGEIWQTIENNQHGIEITLSSTSGAMSVICLTFRLVLKLNFKFNHFPTKSFLESKIRKIESSLEFSSD